MWHVLCLMHTMVYLQELAIELCGMASYWHSHQATMLDCGMVTEGKHATVPVGSTLPTCNSTICSLKARSVKHYTIVNCLINPICSPLLCNHATPT